MGSGSRSIGSFDRERGLQNWIGESRRTVAGTISPKALSCATKDKEMPRTTTNPTAGATRSSDGKRSGLFLDSLDCSRRSRGDLAGRSIWDYHRSGVDFVADRTHSTIHSHRGIRRDARTGYCGDPCPISLLDKARKGLARRY